MSSARAETEKSETMSVSYNLGFGESDDESSGSTVDSEETDARDYWFGKKYFECVIAQIVLQQSLPGQDMADIDATLQDILLRYPYQEALNRFRARRDLRSEFNLERIGDRPFQKLHKVVGAIVRAGLREQKTFLITTIRDVLLRLEPTAPRAREPSFREPISPEPLATNELGQYASALKEYGDEHGFQPVYTTQQLSVQPPKTVAELVCGGLHFEGTGRSKKIARHKAAYAACNHFRIVI